MMASYQPNLLADEDESEIPIFFGNESFNSIQSDESFNGGMTGGREGAASAPADIGGGGGSTNYFNNNNHGNSHQHDYNTVTESSSLHAMYAQLQQQQERQQQQQQELLLKHQQDGTKQQFWPSTLFGGGGGGGGGSNTNSNDNASHLRSQTTSPSLFRFGGGGGGGFGDGMSSSGMMTSDAMNQQASFQQQQNQQHLPQHHRLGHKSPIELQSGGGGGEVGIIDPHHHQQQQQQQLFSNPGTGHDTLLGVMSLNQEQQQSPSSMNQNPFSTSSNNQEPQQLQSNQNNNFIGMAQSSAPISAAPMTDNGGGGGTSGSSSGSMGLSFLPNFFANSFGFGGGNISSSSTSQQQQQQQQQHQSYNNNNFSNQQHLSNNAMMPSLITSAPFESNTVPMPSSIQQRAQVPTLSDNPALNIFGAGIMDGGGGFGSSGSSSITSSARRAMFGGGMLQNQAPQLMSSSISDIGGNGPEDQDADAMLAKELNKLSMKEREGIYLDIHGVNDVVEETPDMVNTKMEEFQMELYKNHNMYSTLTSREVQQERQAYEQALSQDPHFVHHPKLLLMFLRADKFNITDAVNRMYSFFTVKRKLFGIHNLCKHITLTEEFYTPDDIACLKTGYFQILPGRDRSGRAILFAALSLRNFKTYLNVVRSVWYLIMSALEDEETQKKGFVMIGYSHNKQGGIDRRVTWETASLTWTLPMKLMAIHGCCDNPNQKLILQLATLLIGEHNRYRYRIHCGTFPCWQENF